MIGPAQKRPPIAFEARLPTSGIIQLQAGTETRIIFDGRIIGGQRGYSIKLDHPPKGFSTEKNGWIGKQKLKEKDKNGKDRFEKNKAAGGIVITVDESVAPGTQLSLVVAAEVRSGKDKIYYPAPAITHQSDQKEKLIECSFSINRLVAVNDHESSQLLNREIYHDKKYTHNHERCCCCNVCNECLSPQYRSHK
ncbi:hypothetical protein P4C99_18615 [Pontiellaceae bacterium B1224]|nr:hypothetical protein [Pontiellaceae bacterium B1224]